MFLPKKKKGNKKFPFFLMIFLRLGIAPTTTAISTAGLRIRTTTVAVYASYCVQTTGETRSVCRGIRRCATTKTAVASTATITTTHTRGIRCRLSSTTTTTRGIYGRRPYQSRIISTTSTHILSSFVGKIPILYHMLSKPKEDTLLLFGHTKKDKPFDLSFNHLKIIPTQWLQVLWGSNRRAHGTRLLLLPRYGR